MNIKGLLYIGLSFVVLTLATSCEDKEYPGTEYMPDMGHPISYKANYYDYYKFNRWGSEEEYHAFAQPRKPVEGTIPRGYLGIAGSEDYGQRVKYYEAMKGFPLNSFVPFYYEDSDEDRQKAADEITANPFPITDAGLKRGAHLYEIYCGICHGNSGEGDGYLVRDDGKYPAMPTNLVTDAFIDTTAGAFYYTIMYGKNVMGPYNTKLNFEERWDVIHYIRSLQAKERGLKYTAELNTLNDEAIPYSEVASLIEQAELEFKENGMYAHRNAGVDNSISEESVESEE